MLRQLIYGVWLAILSVGAAHASCPSPLGDLDLSGTTDISDVQCAVLVALSTLSQVPAPPCLAPGVSADIDCSGGISVSDVQIVIVMALKAGLPTSVDSDQNECPDGCDVPATCPALPDLPPVDPNPLSSWVQAGPVFSTIAPSSGGGFTDDWLGNGNDTIRVATRRQWGCSMVFFGLTQGAPGTNTIDANDTGREVQVAFYDPLRIKQGCAFNASCVSNPGAQCPNSITYLGWNPVQGGNECNVGSPIDAFSATPGLLSCTVRPLHWNPDWQEPTCINSGCSNPAKAQLGTDVRYTQQVRFVDSHIAQLDMTLENLADLDHPPTAQEFPTVYVGFGKNGLGNYRKLLTPSGQHIAIDIPANDGFFYRQFVSDGPWVALQNDALNYGVGIYYENRLTEYQGWQKDGVFNNTRAVFTFGIPPLGTVRARAYLVLGSFATIQAKMAWLDANLPPFGHLEQPAQLSAYNNVAVSGWALDNKFVSEVRVKLDGAVVASGPANAPRPDVCAMYPGYASCPAAGFQFAVSLQGVSACEHWIEVEAVDSDGNIKTIGRRKMQVSAAPLCTNAADCNDGNPCTLASCNPQTGCSQSPAPPSSGPPEICNGIDDDCDGQVDEGGVCFTIKPVYRFHWSSGADVDHAFSLFSSTPKPGFALEGVGFHVRGEDGPGWIPLYQVYCPACTDHMLTLSPTEGAPAYGSPTLLGYCRPSQAPDAPLHLRRLWSVQASNHFSSTNPAEWTAAQASGYALEAGCWVPQ